MPGFLFTAVVGLLATWVDRKVTARVQYRQGPPWFQPFADLAKLLGKETIVPEGAAKAVFLGAPLIGLAGATLVSTIIWMVNFSHGVTFIGDLIVVLYLLTLPSLAIIFGGSASRNPLSAIGASREMKLILAYELPFILAVFTVVLRTGSIMFGNILGYQLANGMMIQSCSGLIAFLVALIVVQAKLGVVPFDIPEAEQEIAAGALLEYSGPALAVYKLSRAMMYFILPVLLITLFMGGIDLSFWGGIAWFIIKYVIILTLIILIKNTNPRLRTDQAVRFFWGPVTALAAIGFILAMVGW
ncbi:MAG: NADH-quinone oxidoreductase subunit H [Candidatus Margulisbacteria bacterium]|nr:NADH-quinone oxidoreductase subunit H [Candidatus Margulisiibacteriota bacterium]